MPTAKPNDDTPCEDPTCGCCRHYGELVDDYLEQIDGHAKEYKRLRAKMAERAPDRLRYSKVQLFDADDTDAVNATMDNPGWDLLLAATGDDGQATLLFGWIEAEEEDDDIAFDVSKVAGSVTVPMVEMLGGERFKINRTPPPVTHPPF